MPDQITYNGYDAAGRVNQVTRGYGTAAATVYAADSYTPNGRLRTVLDGDNNLTQYVWDGFDRPKETYFPAEPKGSGQRDPNNYEAYVWDANGNETEIRLRDGQDIYFQYDALNRLTFKDSPAGNPADVYYGYDLLNRMLYAHYGSAGGAGVDYAWDALGRITGETASGRTMAYQYDAAGERTRITWPDGGANALYVAYVYDLLGRVTQVQENGASSGPGLLAAYSYDSLGRRTRLDRAAGSGAGTYTSYTRADFISSMTQNLAGSANDVNWQPTYSYSPLGQAITITATNDQYSYHPGPLSKAYAANALNQYATVNGTSFAYDGRGNLTSDGSRGFTYDPENRLLTAAGASIPGVTLTYDPLGRMQTSTTSGATTTLLYSGGDLVGEYDASGNILARYVPGPGVDEPLVWYAGPGTAGRQWLHADPHGSIIAWSNAAGALVGSQGYGPWGEPANWTAGSRYAYTGQIMIPQAQLYDFKARMYDPTLGRFLQSDPIGQASDVNPYAYVGNDPVNGWDPSGMAPPGEEPHPPVQCIGAETCAPGTTVNDATGSWMWDGSGWQLLGDLIVTGKSPWAQSVTNFTNAFSRGVVGLSGGGGGGGTGRGGAPQRMQQYKTLCAISQTLAQWSNDNTANSHKALIVAGVSFLAGPETAPVTGGALAVTSVFGGASAVEQGLANVTAGIATGNWGSLGYQAGTAALGHAALGGQQFGGQGVAVGSAVVTSVGDAVTDFVGDEVAPNPCGRGG